MIKFSKNGRTVTLTTGWMSNVLNSMEWKKRCERRAKRKRNPNMFEELFFLVKINAKTFEHMFYNDMILNFHNAPLGLPESSIKTSA